jgi:hypothetical protein
VTQRAAGTHYMYLSGTAAEATASGSEANFSSTSILKGEQTYPAAILWTFSAAYSSLATVIASHRLYKTFSESMSPTFDLPAGITAKIFFNALVDTARWLHSRLIS